MATRRSRLQIKPNILGGPKGPGIKPGPKAAGKPANNEISKTTKPDTSNKVKSPTRLSSPRKNIPVDPLKEASPLKGEKNKELSEKESVNSENNERKTVSGKNAEKLLEDVSKSTKDKTEKMDIPKLPTRTSFRKFGKVNISAARNVRSEPETVKDDTKSDNENCSEGRQNDSPKSKDITKANDISTDKKPSDNDSGQKSATTTVQRRSRFPKAKPNIVDAGRRKQKENVAKEDKTNNSSVDENSAKVPEITVTDTSNAEKDLLPIDMKQDASQPSHVEDKEIDPPSESHRTDVATPSGGPNTDLLDSPHSLTKILPRLSATPTSVTKSPLKHPTPIIPLSPEKRARTLSTSETPIAKRQKKPKVAAPTDKPPDKTTMKMRDLIRWNPTNNPMKPRIKKTDTVVSKVEKENIGEKATAIAVEAKDDNTPEIADAALPVPQVTIGPDGNIVINEKSLIVKEPELEKPTSQDDEVIDETDLFTNYGSFRKRNMSKRWSKKETKKFYKALAMIGIDFFLISQLFPDRTRFDIKKKFKKEEKVNRALVEKVLKERIKFDPSVFENQEKAEVSTDEEDEKQKGKKETKRGGKKKVGEMTEKETKPAKKKNVKRKRMPLNYYDDDTSEEELEQKRSNSEDGPWQPPSVSQKDGEVVGILMDMSEGRITGEGQGQENVMNVMDVDAEEKFIAVPVSKVQTSGGFIPIEPKNATVKQKPDGSSRNVPSKTVGSVPAIPGIQSISIMETQQTENKEVGPSVGLPVNINVPQPSTVSNSSKRQIILPIFNKTNSAVPQTSMQQNQNLLNSQLQYNSSSVPDNEAMLGTESCLSQSQSGTSQVQLQTGTSLGQLQQYNQEPVSSNATDETDQYILVTMMPQGGGETVIHIYRMHGGGQQQNQVLCTDPFTSQEMTLDNTSINSSETQSQNLTDVENTPTNEMQASLTPSDTPLDFTLTNSAQTDISDITGDTMTHLDKDNTQLIASENSTSTMPYLDIPINTSDGTFETPVSLAYNQVSSDLSSQSNFTQLISQDSTCVEDDKSTLTLTSENTEQEVYITYPSAGDNEDKSELDYEVENC